MQKARDLSLVQDRFEVIFRRFGVEIADQTMCARAADFVALLKKSEEEGGPV